MIDLLELLLLEMLFFAFTWRSKILPFFIGINMVLVLFGSQKLVDFEFGISNVGNLYYASAVFGQFFIIIKEGKKAANINVKNVFIVMLAFLLFRVISADIPPVQGNEEYSRAFSLLVETHPAVFIAAFMGFYLGMQIFMLVIDSLKAYSFVVQYIGAGTVEQLVDSVIFFPVAFVVLPDHVPLIEIMLVGFSIKIAILFYLLIFAT